MTSSYDTGRNAAGSADRPSGLAAPAGQGMPPGASPNGNLLPHHLAQLRQSAISDEVIAGRGYSTVSRPTPGDGRPRDLLRRLAIPAWARNEDARYPGLLIPMFRATGEPIGYQYRPDSAPKDPRGKLRKYAAQAGRASVADVHPLNRDRIIIPTVPLWITEGVKKADSLTTLGLCTVALSGVWNWRSTLGTLGDWEDIPLKGRHVIICYDSDVRGNKSVGRAMERLGKWLKSKGAARVTYVIPPGLNGVMHKGVDDFLAAGGTLDQLWAGASDKPPVPAETLLVDPEGYMVETFTEEALDGRFLWAPGLGWLAYQHHDGRWKPCDDVEAAEEARRWLAGKHAEAFATMQDALKQGRYGPQEIKELELTVAAWRKENIRKRITNLAALARGLVMRDASELDAHPDLVNCPNGVLDLRTGLLGPHDPDLMMTRVTRAKYVPDAAHLDWAKALEAIPPDVRDYVQLRYGQGLTGHVPPDNVVLVEIGGGENGKSTIKAGVRAALGTAGNRGSGYVAYLSARVLMADESAHPTEVMDLRGARIGVLEETPEDHRLRTTRLKLITGDTITARLIRENTVTFANSCSAIVSTNYHPAVAETDHGTWRRLLALVYTYRFRKPHERMEGEHDRAGDPGLRERVKAGDDGRGEAVLAWLAAGARSWYQGGGGRAPRTMGEPPARVASDTAAWRAGCDLVMGYAAEHLMFDDPAAFVSAKELTDDVNRWLKGSGHHEWSDRTSELRFSSHEVFTSHRVSRARRYHYGQGLSRPPGWASASLPNRFHVWLGVRFRTPEDDLSEIEQNNVSAAHPDFGTGGTCSPVNAPVEPHVYGYPDKPSHPSQADWQRWHDIAEVPA